MKKVLCVLLLVVGIFNSLFCYGEVDFSAMETSDIFDLIDSAKSELAERGDVSKVDQGEYTVGEDIAAGKYTFFTYTSVDGVYANSWEILLLEGPESLAEYKGVCSKYTDDYNRYWEAYRAGKDAEQPHSPEKSDYGVVYNIPTNGSVRLSLNDGEIILVEANVKNTKLMAEKSAPLFMN